jgi:predicted  nucleic acid-binding Zn-ribbon protein
LAQLQQGMESLGQAVQQLMTGMQAMGQKSQGSDQELQALKAEHEKMAQAFAKTNALCEMAIKRVDALMQPPPHAPAAVV